jgi:hypothetical protein
MTPFEVIQTLEAEIAHYRLCIEDALVEYFAYNVSKYGARLCMKPDTPCIELEPSLSVLLRRAAKRILGDRPDGAWLCHHCDNPRCYRAEHLFWGTPSDNTRDMYLKCRRTNCSARPEGVLKHVLFWSRKIVYMQRDLVYFRKQLCD